MVMSYFNKFLTGIYSVLLFAAGIFVGALISGKKTVYQIGKIKGKGEAEMKAEITVVPEQDNAPERTKKRLWPFRKVRHRPRSQEPGEAQ